MKKQLKLQLLTVCRNPLAIEFQPIIAGLLTDCGASSSEVNRVLVHRLNNRPVVISSWNEFQVAKAFPKGTSGSSESRKRTLPSVDLNSSLAKRTKSGAEKAAPAEPQAGQRVPTLEE